VCPLRQAFRAVDGAADGFESEEEIHETAEERHAPFSDDNPHALPCSATIRMRTDVVRACICVRRYERLHPDVPVVRNYEDMWMVAKMQKMKKLAEERDAWAAERDAQRKAAAAAAAAAEQGGAEADAGGADSKGAAAAPAGAEEAREGVTPAPAPAAAPGLF
jgi:hypothetical protein